MVSEPYYGSQSPSTLTIPLTSSRVDEKEVFVPETYGISTEQRKEMLAQHISFSVAQGARVESQSDFQAVLIYGHRVNHVLHAIITLFTCLIWGVIWLVLGITRGERREIVQVDNWGNITVQRL